MKSKNSLLIILMIISFGSYAQQIPNAGFENWSNVKTPDDWFSYSSISPFINLCSQNTSDKVEGNSSVEIKSADVSFSTTYEILSLGKGDYSLLTGYRYTPIYFPYRPDTLFFAYKYESPGVDTASVLIKLIKGNKALINTILPLKKSASWFYYAVILSPMYSNSEIPDSLAIQFQSSKSRAGFFGLNGSTLKVDALRMGYAKKTSSTSMLVNVKMVNVFPNPSNKMVEFYINKPTKNASITVYDVNGKVMLNDIFQNESLSIQVENWPKGIYSYWMTNKEKILDNGRFLVNH